MASARAIAVTITNHRSRASVPVVIVRTSAARIWLKTLKPTMLNTTTAQITTTPR
jgi:hypothetical protein